MPSRKRGSSINKIAAEKAEQLLSKAKNHSS